MNIQQIYKLAVKMGIDSDLRGKQAVFKLLKKTNDKYNKLEKHKKSEFDLEALKNPYSDTRILHDPNPKKQIKKILTGIDIGSAELLLADKLKCSLVISHHPLGIGLADLSGVMHLQAHVLAKYGVPINVLKEFCARGLKKVLAALLLLITTEQLILLSF